MILPPSIRRSVLPLFVVGLLVGCSSDSGSATTSTAPTPATTGSVAPVVPVSVDPAQLDAVIDFTVSKGAEEGFAFDRACVADIVGRLGTDDLEALYVPTLDSVPGAVYPVLSAEGAQITEQLTTCLSSQGGDPALAEQVVAAFLASSDGPNLDQDCLRTQVATLNDDQLNAVLEAEAGNDDPNLAKALGAVYVCLVQIAK